MKKNELGTTLSDEELEFLVSAANIAGYMESAEKIFLPDDGVLAKACLDIIHAYNDAADKDELPVFSEFAGDRLAEMFSDPRNKLPPMALILNAILDSEMEPTIEIKCDEDGAEVALVLKGTLLSNGILVEHLLDFRELGQQVTSADLAAFVHQTSEQFNVEATASGFLPADASPYQRRLALQDLMAWGSELNEMDVRVQGARRLGLCSKDKRPQDESVREALRAALFA